MLVKLWLNLESSKYFTLKILLAPEKLRERRQELLRENEVLGDKKGKWEKIILNNGQ